MTDEGKNSERKTVREGQCKGNQTGNNSENISAQKRGKKERREKDIERRSLKKERKTDSK